MDTDPFHNKHGFESHTPKDGGSIDILDKNHNLVPDAMEDPNQPDHAPMSSDPRYLKAGRVEKMFLRTLKHRFGMDWQKFKSVDQLKAEGHIPKNAPLLSPRCGCVASLLLIGMFLLMTLITFGMLPILTEFFSFT
ncbi:MAG: hypothetical protein HOL80_03595 [Candidatus Magasanikbacteria bacterium]|jgi:hypothetical protein|nr:hypothetical protein [Candidatus Magasanikbacteria bacterium]MBT5820681.1 hypothetical protein [Candidatus Magasanikbacteria bacterium]MBT6294406.1 hypothetical protein [Candidatus Magasanikbacteria bacterium]